MEKNNKDRLEAWLAEVLSHQTKGATLVLEDGEEAEISFEDGCLLAYTYEGEQDDLVVHARIRTVSEDPDED